MNKPLHNTPQSKPHRRQLRKASTKPEQLLWAALRNRRLVGLKFRRQQSIGPYIVDFFCLEENLIIEVDGGYHDAVHKADCTRQQFLESQGYHVIRFANEDVLADVEAVTIAIRRTVADIRNKM
jgi:very-short-patch-repair endonuclease